MRGTPLKYPEPRCGALEATGRSLGQARVSPCFDGTSKPACGGLCARCGIRCSVLSHRRPWRSGAREAGWGTGLRPRSIGPGSGGQRANDEDAAMGSCPASGGASLPAPPSGEPYFREGSLALHCTPPSPRSGLELLSHPMLSSRWSQTAAMSTAPSPTHRDPRVAIHASWPRAVSPVEHRAEMTALAAPRSNPGPDRHPAFGSHRR